MTANISVDEWNQLKEKLTALDDWKTTAQSNPFNSGDSAWVLTSTALVLLMSLPGLALFYGGMSQAKNVLSTVSQTYSIACLISILWFSLSYSLCFATGSPVIGGASRFWLVGTEDAGNQKSPSRLGPSSVNALAPTVPESIYMTYQLTFAIITAALVCGSFAERMKFSSMLIFIFFWHFLVYCPVCHSEWAPDGFLAVAGDLDFAGGNVVHICSGFSGLAASILVGPRNGFGVLSMRPHNVVYTVIGGGLLWVGWLGFNGGSAVSAGGSAAFAIMVTQICAGTAGFTWMLIEMMHKGTASMLGIISGAVAGLVVITPASGYVDQTAAFIMGMVGAPLVYLGIQLKHRLGYDDALDAFGVHGLGGVVGGLLTGFFANDFVTGSDSKRGVFYGRPIQLAYQLYGVVVIAAWSFFMSSLILLALRATVGLRVSVEQEQLGLDKSEHGEFDLESLKDAAAGAAFTVPSAGPARPPPAVSDLINTRGSAPAAPAPAAAPHAVAPAALDGEAAAAPAG